MRRSERQKRESGVNVYIVNLFVFSLPNGFSLDCLVALTVRGSFRTPFCIVLLGEETRFITLSAYQITASTSEFVSRKFIVRWKRHTTKCLSLYSRQKIGTILLGVVFMHVCVCVCFCTTSNVNREEPVQPTILNLYTFI